MGVTGKIRNGWLWGMLLVLSSCVMTGTQSESLQQNTFPAGSVVIQAPEGPPGPMAGLLAQSVADALKRRGYTAGAAVSYDSGRKEAAFYVTGTAEALDTIHAPTVAALHWILYDADGNEIAYLTQGVRGNPDSWEYGSPAMLRIVGEEAAADFSVFLGHPPGEEPLLTPSVIALPVKSDVPDSTVNDSQTPNRINDDADQGGQQLSAPASPVPPPPSPPPLTAASGTLNKNTFGIWLDEVTGAPGNGNAALTQAIYSDLKGRKLPFALSPSMASHYIQGVVDVSVLSASREHVAIVWVVSNAAGKEIGRVTQRNDIARGSLHGEWGDTAVYAARGGLDGILAILERDLEQSLEK